MWDTLKEYKHSSHLPTSYRCCSTESKWVKRKFSLIDTFLLVWVGFLRPDSLTSATRWIIRDHVKERLRRSLFIVDMRWTGSVVLLLEPSWQSYTILSECDRASMSLNGWKLDLPPSEFFDDVRMTQSRESLPVLMLLLAGEFSVRLIETYDQSIVLNEAALVVYRLIVFGRIASSNRQIRYKLRWQGRSISMRSFFLDGFLLSLRLRKEM